MADDDRIETLAERLGYPADVVAEEERKARANAAMRRNRSSTVERCIEIQHRLSRVTDELEASYAASFRRLRAEGDPFEVVMPDGVPVLAPILAALANAYAAMLTFEVRTFEVKR